MSPARRRAEILLWIVPLAILVGGGVAIGAMRSSAARREVDAP